MTKFNALSDAQIRAAKPKTPGAQFKLVDGAGLYLLVSPGGSKLWRLKYFFDRSEKSLALGDYPAIGLAEARELASDARKLIAQGVDPVAAKRAEKAAEAAEAKNTMGAVIKEWQSRKSTGKVKSSREQEASFITRFILPALGDKPVSQVKFSDLRAVVLDVESAVKAKGHGGHETTKKVAQLIRAVMDYAESHGYIEVSPAGKLLGVLGTKPKTQSFKAVIAPDSLAEVIRKVDSYDEGWAPLRYALKIQPRLFCRPSELLKLRWSDVDLDAGTVLIRRTKQADTDTMTLLPRQVLVMFTELHEITGGSEWCFPGQRNGEGMSNQMLTKALRRAGVSAESQTNHGWRATARTVMDEQLEQRLDFIEHQLDHQVRDANGRSYNRTAHVEGRGKMLQTWADYLDSLRDGNGDGADNVIELRRRKSA